MQFNVTQITNALTMQWAGNTLREYLLALAVFLGVIILLEILKYVIENRLKKILAQNEAKLDDVIIEIIEGVHWPFHVVLGLYFCLKLLEVPGYVNDSIVFLVMIATVYYVVRSLEKLVDYGTGKAIERKGKSDASIIILSRRILKVVLWVVALLIVLANMGIEVTALITGLGIGGVAIAFALQRILEDIFASFSIYFDKPFEVGDYIVIGDDSGTVKRIGIKSTRLQTLQGEELVVSNRELTDARVHNFKKMKDRRVSFKFGVGYDTPSNKLKKIPETVKKVVENTKMAHLDRVHFQKMSEFSLDYEVVYYVDSKEYSDYVETQEQINLGLLEEFRKQGIEIPYPTQTLFVNKKK
jgi:small-conductance mechanosensitive channel